MTDDVAVYIKEAIDVINPVADLKEKCQKSVGKSIEGVANTVHLRDYLTPANLRKRFDKVRKLARRMKAALHDVSDLVSGPVLAHIDEIEAMTNMLAPDEKTQGIQTKGAPSLDPVAYCAAACAFDLLTRYSTRQPSATSDGPFLSLAAILHEAATGEPMIDAKAMMDRSCRRVLDERRRKSVIVRSG